jgi:hypothetical protein
LKKKVPQARRHPGGAVKQTVCPEDDNIPALVRAFRVAETAFVKL